MVGSCLQGEPRKKELMPTAGRMRVRYKRDHPDSEERRCLGEAEECSFIGGLSAKERHVWEIRIRETSVWCSRSWIKSSIIGLSWEELVGSYEF